MITITAPKDALSGLDMAQRQHQFAVAKALTQTALDVKADLIKQMKRSFDRPTPYALRSLFITPATKQRLQSHVWVKDDRATSNAGTPATNFILPHIVGGQRRRKRFENALQYGGFLSPGHVVVPGQGAKLDAYGNISRGQIIQILSQLRIRQVAGYNREMGAGAKGIAAQRRAGGRFFYMPPGRSAPQGIYQREFFGRNITPVLIFKPRAIYKRTFPFEERSQTTIQQRFDPNFAQAFELAMATAEYRQAPLF